MIIAIFGDFSICESAAVHVGRCGRAIVGMLLTACRLHVFSLALKIFQIIKSDIAKSFRVI